MVNVIPTLPSQPTLDMGYPTPEQLALINKYRPKGTPPIEADEVISIPFIASDNLVSRSLGAWDIDSLYSMAKLFPGRPLTLDHRWEQVEKTVGFVYDAAVIKTPDAPPATLNKVDNFSLNRQIVARNGFAQLVLYTCVEATSPVVSGLRFRRLGDVSTGGFTNATPICPLCETSFDSSNCPHYIPDFWTMLMADYGEIDEELVAPFFIRTGFIDAVELSLVLCGNLPGASVVAVGDE